MIFSTVTQFVEQVGRRKVARYGDLDQLICVYVGPTDQASSFEPLVNSAHPNYPLMFVTDTQVTAKEALVSEISVTYAGKILYSGQLSYVSQPITSESPVQGSRDFQRTFVSQRSYPQAGTGTGAGTVIFATYDYGTETIAVRYIGTQCTVKYQAYPRPTSLHYSSLGNSRVKWSILSQTVGTRTVVASGVIAEIAQLGINGMAIPPIPSIFAANLGFSLEQQGKWYNCTEVYGPTF